MSYIVIAVVATLLMLAARYLHRRVVGTCPFACYAGVLYIAAMALAAAASHQGAFDGVRWGLALWP